MKRKIYASLGMIIVTLSLKATKKPNIIFFLVDDLGWMDVAYNGSQFYYTPTIDSLAKNGMIFNEAYAMPTSSPSRASFMSGLYSPRTDIYAVDAFAHTPSQMKKIKGIESKKVLDCSFPTIAEVLKENGYNTCHIGKWHLGNEDSTYPCSRGFDINIAGCEIGSPKSYYSPYENIKFLEAKSDNEYLTTRLADEAVNFLENYKSDKPFFLNMAFYAVHVPINSYPDDVKIVEGRTPEGGRNNVNYAAMVYSVDLSMTRILKVLKEKGIDKNTVIFFTSDNGGQSMVTDNKPLRGQKGNIYEGGIRVPTFVYWPEIIKPLSECNTPISIIDYFPTIASIASIPDNKYKVDGENILPLLLQKGNLKRKSLFWHLPNYTGRGCNAKVWQDPVSVIRKGDWKLIQHFEDNEIELYNIKNDLSEKHNVALSNKALVQELLLELETWQNKVNAPIPLERNLEYDVNSRDWINNQ